MITQITNKYWEYIGTKGYRSSDISGKWCIWFGKKTIDEAWSKVKNKIIDGTFIAAKRSINLRNNYYVIIFYTPDYTNQEEIFDKLKILQVLFNKEKGFRYKRDIDTIKGINKFTYKT